MPSISQILIASSPSAPMTACAEIRAVPGRGLEGDRYFNDSGTFSPHPQKPDFEITLIEREKIEAFALESGLPFTAAHARRNLVTEGVDLNALVGQEFMAGTVMLRGIRLCEPCTYLAKISFPQTLQGLVHKAGLRAQIISEGVIRVGDKVQVGGAPDVITRTEQPESLWWLIPGVLAGMPMPFIHPDRRIAGSGALSAFDDELPMLHAAGIRAVVSLLNIPSDASVYESAGFAFFCLPIADGGAPTFEEIEQFIQFVQSQRIARRPVAVHCEAGLGRTGTVLAAYLIAGGESSHTAIQQVRSAERAAIETARQLHFLDQYAAKLRGSRAFE